MLLRVVETFVKHACEATFRVGNEYLRMHLVQRAAVLDCIPDGPVNSAQTHDHLGCYVLRF